MDTCFHIGGRTPITPPALVASQKCAIWNLRDLRPFRKGFRHIINRQDAGSRSITGLFGFISPSHISRFVMAVIINTIQGASRRTRANAIKKLLNGSKPKFNTSTTVSRVIRFIRVRASSFSVIIRIKLWRWFSVQAQSVRSFADGQGISVPTPARLGTTVQQGAGVNHFKDAAVALHVPKRVSFTKGEGDHGQPFKFTPCQIHESGIAWHRR